LILCLPSKPIATKFGISVPAFEKHVGDLLAHVKVMFHTHLAAHRAERGIAIGPPELSHPQDELGEEA